METDDAAWKMVFPLCANVMMSIIAYFLTIHLIPNLKDMFIKANLYGIDMNKTNGKKVPEAFGVVTGCIFLVTLFLFIPIPFTDYMIKNVSFPHNEFIQFLAALLSICCMVLLGFADDVLDLRWRHKLLLPTIASLPLLMVYYVNFNSTLIIVPKPLRHWFGFSLDLGILYYVYMGMLAVFCTNAINILAGINGLEVGQSLIIAISIALFNTIELSGKLWKTHQFSLYIMIPYISTTFALLRFNWYPSKVFVGDTFCYLSGMTFAVVGIIGHFGKTTLLFFIPQIINFLYSVPQLFHLVPCPRHRLPKYILFPYNKHTGKLDNSVMVYSQSDLNILEIEWCTLYTLLKSYPNYRFMSKFNLHHHLLIAFNEWRDIFFIHWLPWLEVLLCKFIMWTFKALHIVKCEEDDKNVVTCNNLTLINFVLINLGPMKEEKLTIILLLIQIGASLLAFAIRYPLASVFYDV